SVQDLLERFFNQAEQLAARPDDVAQRRVVLNSAAALTNTFNALARDLLQTNEGLDNQLGQVVQQVNGLTARIADLNFAVQQGTIQGLPTSDLRDQRDELVNQPAQLVDVRVTEQDFGVINVIAAGAPVVIGNQTVRLQFAVDSQNNAGLVRVDQLAAPLQVTGGQAAGLLNVRNQTLPDLRRRLDTLARELARPIHSAPPTPLRPTLPLPPV